MVVKEIGGYFGLEELMNNEYYKDVVSVNNGRNALLYLVRAKNIKKLYMPYYLVDGIGDVCIPYGCELEYYYVDAEFMPLFDKSLAEDEYLFVVNYYGQLTDEKIMSLNQRFGQIIIDHTQSFFQKPLVGIDTIYTCRKYFGVPDGAYVSTDKKINEGLGTDLSKERMSHILGRYEGIASDYYEIYIRIERALDREPLKYMSELTHNILGAIDYERVRQTRNENYSYLQSELGSYNKLKLITPDGAFAYPLYVENGTEIRKKLAKKKIYVPTLWPNVLTDLPETSIEHKYAANILPLPCDQRYGIDDMEHLVEEIKKYL